ncbi:MULTISPECIES: MetQ/NlpA family ABC transporter substrate-binding protein [Enterococcus]|uniref:Lipoprotein n=1 Tax=Enterococcus alishanensis TaxID=1303817 RepID=A0ABS6T970_9ENTE|nr:MetQ/NlpA family ABC transporter substrate-binding protein [Enterococcus alishanensis]MBV7389447.1 MetQ/NlpA family ABC transporter substrate-binding protein [Enterococcus alishanensis]
MKKWAGLVALGLVTFGLAACGNSDSSSSDSSGGDSNTLVVGASPTPHAEILEHVKPILEKEGVNLEIKKFDDYVLPNKALADGDIDANYFQHLPFLNKAIKENDYKFSNVGAIHIEPMGLYSQDVKNIDDIPEGTTIITSNSESDWGRIITILKNAGLVDVKEGTDLETATFDDITDNPKNLEFKHDIDPSLLTTTYQNEPKTVVAINANFAYGAGLNPLEDSIALEEDNSPYVNVLVSRTEDKDNENIQKLNDVLHQKEVQDWILKKWGGSVKPVASDAGE